MDFSKIYSIAGGLLIGLSASILMIAHGKICGLSGIFSGLILSFKDSWRWFFLSGFFMGCLAIRFFFSDLVNASEFSLSIPVSVVAGLLVGFGTKLGGGCTSGHGICGISRLSKRSVIATLLFMVSAMLTVLLRKII